MPSTCHDFYIHRLYSSWGVGDEYISKLWMEKLKFREVKAIQPVSGPGCSMTCVTSSHKASGTTGVCSPMFRPVGKAESIQLSFSGTGQHGALPQASHQHLLSSKKGSLGASVHHALRRQREEEVRVGGPRQWGLEPGKVSPSVRGRAWHCCRYTRSLGGKWKVWAGARNGRKWSTLPDAFPEKKGLMREPLENVGRIRGIKTGLSD